MVPFSFPQPLLKSRVTKKHFSTIEVWTPGVWRLKLGAFALSCLPAFLILIPVPVFCLNSVPLCLCGQSAFLPIRGLKWWPVRLAPSVTLAIMPPRNLRRF